MFSILKRIKIAFLYFKKQDKEIKIKEISSLIKEEALIKMNIKSTLIESVFHPKPAPYFAILTTDIHCPKEFKPIQRKKDGHWISWTMFANKRQGIGVCDKTEIFFIHHKLLKYCTKQNSLFEIDYFIPVSSKIKKTINLKKSVFQLETLIFCNER